MKDMKVIIKIFRDNKGEGLGILYYNNCDMEMGKKLE